MIKKKKWLVVTVVVLLMLALAVSIAGARGPANRATGSVFASHPNNPDSYIVFDAHAESPDGRREAKGTLYWYWDVAEKTVEEIEAMAPRHIIDVKYVKVEGDTAWFAGTDSVTHPDLYMFLQVTDGGSPGAGNDDMPMNWIGYDSVNAKNKVENKDYPGFHNWQIYGGNLTVHYYE